MICPYCVEEIAAGSTQHSGCPRENNKPFPLFYLDFHGDPRSKDPIVLSVVGFSGHGKTVYLASLFDFLDHQLPEVWTDFAVSVLDQDSLHKLNENRRRLRSGRLPDRTGVNFPRPGIFRPTNLPHLTDTTILICDPPGEAFTDEERISELAGFVKRSSCVMFLIDITILGDSAADEMATLLETYLLGLRRMGIKHNSQHLVVVYTKADQMQSASPEFSYFLAHHPELKSYLNEQRPSTLAHPADHLRRLEEISNQLCQFTRDGLGAHKFINLTQNRFESVNYTAVTSLGAPPEVDGNNQQLKTRMSPRGVVDPLLIVLDKPIKPSTMPPVSTPQVPATPARPRKFPTAAAIIVALLIIMLLVWLIAARSNQATGNSSPQTRISLPADFVKNYHGTINDKYAIEMTLRKDGNQLSGQYLYKKYNIPIRIKGTIDGNRQITLYGYDKSGAENDIFEGTLGSNNTFQGQFKTRKEMRAMPFILVE